MGLKCLFSKNEKNKTKAEHSHAVLKVYTILPPIFKSFALNNIKIRV